MKYRRLDRGDGEMMQMGSRYVRWRNRVSETRETRERWWK